MTDIWKGWLLLAMVGVALSALVAGAAPPDAPKDAGAVLKTLLGEERNQIEKEIAARMMRRIDLSADKKARLEMEIDLRIIQRAVVAMAAQSKPESDEQAAAWLRGRQLRDAVRGMEEALAQDTTPPTGSQKDSLEQLHKLSYDSVTLKQKDLDEFCGSVARAMVNCVNPTPVNAKSIVVMRPKAQANTQIADRPPTVGGLTEEVQKLAAISVPLRQQLLALAAAASAKDGAGEKEKDEARALYAVLAQSIGLARGLQSNTAVGNDARAGIEAQLAEGIVLFSDGRTREAGKTRIDALGQYRQTLTRIGKMALTKDQMDLFASAFAWAQANPETGAKLLGTVELYMAACDKWDALPKDVAVPTPLRKSLEDLRQQFAKNRAAFMQAASRIGAGGSTPLELEQTLDEIHRVAAVVDDLQSMGMSIDTINSYKIRPVGGLERKITTAALAAASSIAGPTRNDGQKFLSSVHALAKLAQTLSSKPLTDVPPAVLLTWASSATTTFETRWKGIVFEQANLLIGGTIELDKAKVARLEMALALGATLRTAAQLETALTKTPSLARWADWAIDPASLQWVLSPYKESVSNAIFGFSSDNQESLDKWSRMSGRYGPLIALVLRDAAYAEECQALPIGFPADIGRLATPFEDAPFSTERYASYAIGVWAILERSGEIELADQIGVGLAKRLARDLHLSGTIDETPPRIGKKPRL